MPTSDFFRQTRDHIYSSADNHARGLTLEQIREQRLAQVEALKGKTYADNHNKYVNKTIRAIEQGKRLGSKDLDRLVEQAKNLAGISANELLDFTLGATKRNKQLMKVLDATVLNVYLHNVRRASNKFIGGITIQEVINNSRMIDIDRANSQIWLANLFKRKGNVFYFMTNASYGTPITRGKKKGQFERKKNNGVINHIVTVQLHSYDSLVLNHSKPPTQKEIEKLIKEGNISFDCDCGRHQYWYRYIATVGKYNYGIDENRYPSTRNPHLTGVACKHVLRVMNHLQSGNMKIVLKAEATKDIANAAHRGRSNTKNKKQIQRENEKQVAALNNWNEKLHWARKIHIELDKAVKDIAKSKKKQLEKNPDKPPQEEMGTYNHHKKLLNHKYTTKDAKEIYQKHIAEFEAKWGKR